LLFDNSLLFGDFGLEIRSTLGRFGAVFLVGRAIKPIKVLVDGVVEVVVGLLVKSFGLAFGQREGSDVDDPAIVVEIDPRIELARFNASRKVLDCAIH